MSKLLLTVAVAALVLPAAACGKSSTQYSAQKTSSDDAATHSTSEPAVESTAQTKTGSDGYKDPTDQGDAMIAPAATTATTTAVKVVYLGADDVSVKDVLGEEIHGADGKAVGKVEDVLIGDDGHARSLIISTGAFSGLVGKKAEIGYSQVSMGVAPDSAGKNDPTVMISLTDAEAKTAKAFDQAGLNDYRLASEIIGSKIDLAAPAGDNDNAVVHDLIMANDGSFKRVIIQRSVAGSIGGGDLYAFDYPKLAVAEGDGGLALDATEQDLNSANKFEYTRGKAMDEAVDSATDPDNKM